MKIDGADECTADRRRLRGSGLARAAAALLGLVPGISTPVHAGGDPCQPHWDQTPGQPGFNGWVYSLNAFDLDGGTEVVAGGLYTEADGQPINGIARWDGKLWSPLGDGVNERVFAIETFDSGDGPALYIAGNFTMSGDQPINYIARWDSISESWHSVGGGVNGVIITMIVHDDGSGPALYAGGGFTTAGGRPAAHIARWDGTQWSEVGGGVNDIVRAMVSFDAGDGAALYIGGLFSIAGGAHGFNRAARWDGEQWAPLGVGLTGQGIRTMAVYDDGAGPSVHVGGLFDTAGGLVVNNVARWDHETESWSDLGLGTNERVVGMQVFDDGSGAGQQLYLGGWFTMMDGQPVNRIARWDGESWTQPGGGTNTVVRALTVAQLAGDEAPALYAGGGFTQVEGKPAASVARWVGCAESPMPSDLNGDGAVDVFDLLILLGAWGECGDPDNCEADLNGDGAVDVFDLLTLLGS